MTTPNELASNIRDAFENADIDWLTSAALAAANYLEDLSRFMNDTDLDDARLQGEITPSMASELPSGTVVVGKGLWEKVGSVWQRYTRRGAAVPELPACEFNYRIVYLG